MNLECATLDSLSDLTASQLRKCAGLNHAQMSLYAQEIRQSVEMRQVLEYYGVAVNAAGYALCPFHHEKTASLKAYARSFYCFGCGIGGDVIRFVRELFGLDFADTIAKLIADFMPGLSVGQRLTVRQARSVRQRRTRDTRTGADEAEQKQRRFSEYLDLLCEEEYLRSVIRQCAPTTQDAAPNSAWIAAVRRVEHIGYLLDTFYLRENAAVQKEVFRHGA